MEFAQIALRQQRMQGLYTRMVLEQMTDHQDPAEFFRQSDHLFRLVEPEAERLLDKYILAGLKRRLDQGIMLAAGAAIATALMAGFFSAFRSFGDCNPRRDFLAVARPASAGSHTSSRTPSA